MLPSTEEIEDRTKQSVQGVVLEPSGPPDGEWRTAGSFFAALVIAGLFVPSIATMATAVTYLLSPDYAHAWSIGGVVSLTSWLVGAGVLRGFTSVASAQSTSYLAFRARLDVLDAQLRLHSNVAGPARTSALAEANAYRRAISAQAGLQKPADEPEGTGPFDLGPLFNLGNLQWVTGYGYIALWAKLQRAEEALLILVPAEEALTVAAYDEARIRGSTIPGRDALLFQLNQARKVILEVSGLSATWSQTRPDMERALQPHDGASKPTVDDELVARECLRIIRRTINEFRSDRREGIFHARNRLYSAFSVTTLFTLLAVVLATTVRGEAMKDGIVAALVFFLVGALVGLFNRLRLDAGTSATVDDCGLSVARLVHTPLFCGLAGVGGAFILPMLSSLTNVAANSATVSIPRLDQIFDLQENTFGLLFAAIFGLSPAALIARLQEESEQYKADLRQSEPHSAESVAGSP